MDTAPTCVTHCWHYTGEYQAINPPNWSRVCCHCGAHQWSRDADHGDKFAEFIRRALPERYHGRRV